MIGLTTAATLWVVAAIGLAIGSHAYVQAVGTTALVFVILVILGRVEDFLFHRRRSYTVEVVSDPEVHYLDAVRERLETAGLSARISELDKRAERYRATLEVRAPRGARDTVLWQLSDIEGVRKVTVV